MKHLLELPGRGDQRISLENGISPAIYPFAGYLWQDGENIVFKNGGPTCMPGWEEIITTATPVMVLEQAYDEVDKTGRIYLGFASMLQLWQASRGIVTLGAGYGGSSWSLAPWGSWLIATNGVDPIQIWKGNYETQAVALGTSAADFTKAALVTKLGPHLIVANVDGERGQSRIVWSAEDDVENWDIADEASLAGDLYIRDLESGIISMVPLGNELALYSKDTMSILTYKGAPLIFGVEKIMSNIGSVGKNAVAVVEDKNIGMSRQGVWITDGVASKYVDNPAMGDFIQEDINWDAADKVVAFNDENSRMVVFYYPSGSSTENDAGVGFNYDTGAWTRFSFGRNAAIPRQVFSYPITAGGNKLYWQGSGTTANGAAINSWIVSQPMDMGDVNIYKRLQHVQLGMTGSGLTLKLGVQETLSDTVSYFFSETAGLHNYFQDRETPLLTIRFEGNGPWSVTGIIVDGVPTGRYV